MQWLTLVLQLPSWIPLPSNYLLWFPTTKSICILYRLYPFHLPCSLFLPRHVKIATFCLYRLSIMFSLEKILSLLNFLVSFRVRVFQHPHCHNNSSFFLSSSFFFCAFASQIFNKFRRAEIAKHSASWVELFVRFAGRKKKEKLFATPKSWANRFLGRGEREEWGCAGSRRRRCSVDKIKKFSRCLHNKGSRGRGREEERSGGEGRRERGRVRGSGLLGLPIPWVWVACQFVHWNLTTFGACCCCCCCCFCCCMQHINWSFIVAAS